MIEERAYEGIRQLIREASTVNYHLLKACNMGCRFCFAPFPDISARDQLGRGKSLQLVSRLCQAEFRKINFAGGEPTLLRWLPDLIHRAKSHHVTTSIVTNGSCITPDWLYSLEGSLDFIALSIDSVDAETQRNIGRAVKGASPMSAERYFALSELIRGCGIRLKVNTVVNRFNLAEDLTSFILAMQPERWKMFQVLPVEGQNDSSIDDFTVTDTAFRDYVERHRGVESNGIKVVPEGNDLMTGSYVMVDPLGRFFDNTDGRHTYSKPILEVGVVAALSEVRIDALRFRERGGDYQ